MRHLVIALSALVVSLSFPAHAEDPGAAVFAEVCATCHLESLSAAEADTADDLAAPAMNLLSTIIREKTGDNEATFVAHVVDFTFAPAEDKVLAMPEAVDRFGLMPEIDTLYPDITRADVEAVAHWLFGHYDYESELAELMEHQALTGRR